jgi:lipoprotein signal peptidase
MVRALALVATAVVLAAIDLAHKASAGAANVHPRSAIYVVGVIVLCAAWVGAILAVRSWPLAVAGGVLVGGALANVASLALWPGVPNPIATDAIEFNLADVFVLVGFLLVVAVTLGLVVADPKRLREPLRLS